MEEHRPESRRQIDHFGRQRKVTIIGNLAGATMNVAVDAFNKAFADVHAPPDYQLIASGRAKTQAESNGAFLAALVLSLLFMYMILAAQFESFVHPITILLAVPLTIPFALLSLILLGQALTIYSILGVFLLSAMNREGTAAAFAGMLTGIAVVTVVWLWTPLAWPWYAPIGSVVTVLVALTVDRLRSSYGPSADRSPQPSLDQPG